MKLFNKPNNPNYDNEFINYLRLARSKAIGNIRFTNLISKYGSASSAISAITKNHNDIKLPSNFELANLKTIEDEINNTIKFGAKIIASYQDNYPQLLLQLPDYPAIITVKGNADYLNDESIAIVGSRNASFNGVKFAGKLASELASYNVTTVSGLARGIDTEVHNASKKYRTIAVIGSGIDQIYPPENRKLMHDIFTSGVVITEQAFGAPPIANNFPKRNRIISGLSLATVIIEARINSGSLITARLALEQNKEVFAVPGSPLDPRSIGTNNLIKQGAYLIDSVDDIFNVIDFSAKQVATPTLLVSTDKAKQPLGNLEDLIYEKLGNGPIHLDNIAISLNIPISKINIAVSELEIEGLIVRIRGNMIEKSC